MLYFYFSNNLQTRGYTTTDDVPSAADYQGTSDRTVQETSFVETQNFNNVNSAGFDF